MEVNLIGKYIFDSKDFNQKNKNILTSFVENHHFSTEYSIKYWLECAKSDDGIDLCFAIKSPVEITGCVYFVSDYFEANCSKLVWKPVLPYYRQGCRLLEKNYCLFKNGKMKMEFFAVLKLSNVKAQILKPISEMLFEDDETSDFTIVSKNGNLKVHRNILAYSSPVFKAMFEHDCQEKRNSQVKIDDVDFEVIKTAVFLMYKRKLPKNVQIETMLGVYIFADRYDMNDRKVITKWFKKYLSTENVCEFAKLTIDEHLDELLDLCIKFMADDVENVAQFKNFDDLPAEISVKILRKVAEFKSE